MGNVNPVMVQKKQYYKVALKYKGIATEEEGCCRWRFEDSVHIGPRIDENFRDINEKRVCRIVDISVHSDSLRSGAFQFMTSKARGGGKFKYN